MTTPRLTRPQAILFDLDETLTDRLRSIARWAEQFARDHADRLGALPIPELAAIARKEDGYGYRPREAVFASLLELLPWRSAPSLDDLLGYWNRTFPGCCVERAGAHDVLAALRQSGIRLGVVTNGGVAMQEAKLDALAIRSMLDTVVISGAVEVAKPDARIFQLTLDALDVAAERAWFVGDHPANDVLGAEGARLTPIWLRGIHPWPEGVPEPRWQIDMLYEVVALARTAQLSG